jgi:hypothetical protein
MKSLIKILLVVLTIAAVSGASYAATYQYVDVNGSLKTVVANTQVEALRMVPDIHPNSGVIMIDGSAKIEGSLAVGEVVVATSTTKTENNLQTTVVGSATPTAYPVTQGQAQATATAFYKGGGTFSSIQLTSIYGLAIYSVKYNENGTMVEIMVNATTGDVIVLR